MIFVHLLFSFDFQSLLNLLIKLSYVLSLCQCGITLLVEPISTIPGYFLTHTQQGILFT